MSLRSPVVLMLICVTPTLLFAASGVAPPVMRPAIDGPWWQVAGEPDLGRFTSPDQEPVDFCIWQAADGTWQLWSCIRKTKCGGYGRLLYGWEGQNLTEPNWKPQGIRMEAQTKFGETAGGLQAPFVALHNGTYHMLYGDWENICLATSRDGKQFERQLQPNGKAGLFTEGAGANTRDPFAILIGKTWRVYYTAFPNKQAVVYCRTSPDLRTYGESTSVAFGGRAGIGGSSAECPQVVEHGGRYYLFRTQHYQATGEGPRTCVYSSTDPMNFGINQDRLYFVAELPVAAPEIIRYQGQDYIAALLPSLKGIRVAKLVWTPND
jgi:hypothetical protein